MFKLLVQIDDSWNVAYIASLVELFQKGETTNWYMDDEITIRAILLLLDRFCMNLDDVECEEEMERLIDYVDVVKRLTMLRYRKVKDFAKSGGLTPLAPDAASLRAVESPGTDRGAGEASR